MNYSNDFKDYALNGLGISKAQYMAWDKLQETLYNRNSMTPYILEEREMRATQIDIFSRMMGERIIWAAGVVNENMSTIIQAQLMYLDSIGSDDIKIYINGPGGSVSAGLSIIDVMSYISCDISTVNVGMAASMDAVLLGSGTKGKRMSLPNSKVMIHSVSSGCEGVLADMKISLNESEKYNTLLFNMLGEYCNKDPEQIKKDADRDYWMTSEEALEYGIIDDIITKKSK